MTEMIWQATAHRVSLRPDGPAVPEAFGAGTAANALDRLRQGIEEHIASEEETLASYRQLAVSTGDPLTGQLMRLLVEEEERHHHALRSMAWGLHRAMLGGVDSCRPPTASDAAVTVSRGIENERATVRQLRELARSFSHVGGGLFGLLFELMALDSQRHELILRFIQRRLRLGGDERDAMNALSVE